MSIRWRSRAKQPFSSPYYLNNLDPNLADVARVHLLIAYCSIFSLVVVAELGYFFALEMFLLIEWHYATSACERLSI